MKQTRLIMIGPFPPPVMGMASVNKSMENLFRNNNHNKQLIIFNTSPLSLKKKISYHLYRFFKFIKILFQISGIKTLDKVYMSTSGGYGQIYEILLLLFIRFKKLKDIIIHHHSFNYIDKKKQLSSFLFCIAGPNTIHVTLSALMAKKLKYNYSTVRLSKVLSNIYHIEKDKVQLSNRNKNNEIIMGYLSNISEDKGIFEFIDLHSAIRKNNHNVSSIIAGPFSDDNIKKLVLEKIEKTKSIKWIGPVYAEDKRLFFRLINYFIFPTRYFNEAEPLVIYEAFSYGVPVVSYGRGCIPEQIGSNELCGKVIPPNYPFVKNALPWIEKRINNQKLYQQTVSSINKHFYLQKKIANNNFESFFTQLISN